jgi:hypothetical protein
VHGCRLLTEGKRFHDVYFVIDHIDLSMTLTLSMRSALIENRKWLRCSIREQTTTMHYDCLMNLIIPVCFDFRSPEILDMTRFDQTNNSKTIGIGGINCTGSEQYLAECSISRWENSTCSSNFVAISCSKFILRLI